MPGGRVISGFFFCKQKIFLKRKLTETLRQIYSVFGGKASSKSDLKTPKVMEVSVERDRENQAGSFSVLLSSTVTAQRGPSRPVLRECFLLVETERYCITVQLSHSEDSRSSEISSLPCGVAAAVTTQSNPLLLLFISVGCREIIF